MLGSWMESFKTTEAGKEEYIPVGIVLLLVAVVALTFYVRDQRRLGRQDKQNWVTLESHWAYTHMADDFIYMFLKSHPDLIRYDRELLESAKRIATAREELHCIVHNTCSDDYKSSLRDLLP